MRISDWSSDVCSSDLAGDDQRDARQPRRRGAFGEHQDPDRCHADRADAGPDRVRGTHRDRARSEERRVGKELSVSVDLGGRSIIKKKTKKHKEGTPYYDIKTRR